MLELREMKGLIYSDLLRAIWCTMHLLRYNIHMAFFRDFRHSNQTSKVSKCSNVLFIFFDFSSCRVLSKTEENTEKYFLIKQISKEQKIWRTLQKKNQEISLLGLMQRSLHLELVDYDF
jgi:hypothetical protein